MMRSLAASIALLVVLPACGSTGSSAPKPLGEPLVVPAFEDAYYVFRAGAIERRPDGKLETVPSETGRPASAAVDANGGWAAVAYERGMFAVQLAEGRVLPMKDVEWSSPPGALCVHGGLVGATEDGTIGLYRVADGVREWRGDGRAILTAAGLKELHFVLPLSKESLLLVGFKGMDPLGYPDTRVVALDRSRGTPVLEREQPVRDLHWLHASVSDGQALYLAGEHDEVITLPGIHNQQLVQSLVVVHVDPVSLAARTLVREELPGREVRVRRLSAGFGLVALALEGGELRVYRVEGGLATRAVYSNRYTTEVSVACLGPQRIVIASGNETQLVEIP